MDRLCSDHPYFCAVVSSGVRVLGSGGSAGLDFLVQLDFLIWIYFRKIETIFVDSVRNVFFGILFRLLGELKNFFQKFPSHFVASLGKIISLNFEQNWNYYYYYFETEIDVSISVSLSLRIVWHFHIHGACEFLYLWMFVFARVL